MLGRVLADVVRSLRSGKRSAAGDSARAVQAEAANPLAEYFYNNTGRGTGKWHHYFEIYHRHLAKFRGKSPVVVEIGVAYGGSLPMWHWYFGLGARVVGIDVDPACSRFADDATTILIGDQADRNFLASVRERVPRIDVLIDDGGHTMTQQIATFEELYPHVDIGGVYICEDVHTSFWSNFGGGYRRQGTFLEYSKALVDRLYGWHSREPERFGVDDVTRTTHGIHFYDSMVVLEKRRMEPPQQFFTYGAGADAVPPIVQVPRPPG